MATRQAVNACVNATADVIPGLVAGAADLTGNTGMALADAEAQSVEHPGGRQVHYGIREHAMGGGHDRHGRPRRHPPGRGHLLRLQRLHAAGRSAWPPCPRAHVIYSWTHDSVGLGQDGPTHQPVEHLASLRAMPGLQVVRPADANETAQAWRLAVDGDGPTALILTRQSCRCWPRRPSGRPRGWPAVATCWSTTRHGPGPTWCSSARAARSRSASSAADGWPRAGRPARVVSLPCWEWFEAQDRGVPATGCCPPGCPRLAVEAASSFGWDRYADATVSIDTFGASAPGAGSWPSSASRPTHVADAGCHGPLPV